MSESKVSAKPLFDTFRERGDAAAFAQKMNISLQRLMNWEERGIPFKMVPLVARAMSLPSTDDYYALAKGQKVGEKWQGSGKAAAPQSDGEKLLELIRTFLDTDTEGKQELLEAAQAVAQGNGTAKKSIRGRSRGR